MKCAVCLAPVTMADFAARGTEIVHKHCLTGVTLLTRFRVKLARAKLDRATAQREAAEARVRTQEAESEVQRERTARREHQATASGLRETLAAEQRRNRSDREERELAVRRHAELLTENDRLRNELNVRTLGGAPKVDSKPDQQSPATDDRDPSVVRAELLELD